MSECHAVISQIVHMMRRFHLRKTVGREHVIEIIDMARARELRRMYDWALRRRMGISLAEWAKGTVKGGMDDLVLRAGLTFMNAEPFRVELIVAGFIRGHTMFFRAVQKNRLEEGSTPGVYAIGRGQIHAMRVLNKRGQSYAMSLPRTLFHVHEAMVAARRDTTVGTTPGYVVIKKHDARLLFYPATLPTLENWRKAYAKRGTTASLDDSRVAGLDIFQQLKVLHPTKSGIDE